MRPIEIDKKKLNCSNTKGIEHLLTNMPSILSSVQLPYTNYLYMGLEEIEKLSAYEQALILSLENHPHKTEFEPMPSKRSFFSPLKEKMSEAESVLLISVALPYPSQVEGLSKSVGIVDGSSWYYDYHSVLRRRMENAFDKILEIEHLPLTEKECFVDTSDYIDRELAFLCGLGTYGKNHMLIHSELGTQFHIGHMVMVFSEKAKLFYSKVELGLELGSKKMYKLCHSCNKCVQACPAGICGTLEMNRLKCVSYLTQTKRELTDEEMMSMGNRLYGCDVCQKVCPANKVLREPAVESCEVRHMTSYGFEGIDLLESLDLSQRAFKRQYGDRGFSWRGVKIFKRNALISIGNSGNTEFLKDLEDKRVLSEDSFLAYYYDYAVRKMKSV